MKLWLTFLSAYLLMCVSGYGADVRVFKVEPKDVVNIVLDAPPNDSWIFSMTLTKEKLAAYSAFTKANLDEKISLVVAGVELYSFTIRQPVNENPLTFRSRDSEVYAAVLTAYAKAIAPQ